VSLLPAYKLLWRSSFLLRCAVAQSKKRIMPEASDTMAKRLEIKKYPNRRYYDATHSRHLTLEEIRTLIQQDYDIIVTDAKTGADITAQVLTQIILDLETAKLDSFPVPLLVRLIRMNDQLVKDFIEKYFNQALGSFLNYQQQIEEQIRRSHGLPATFPTVAAWTKAMLEPIASAFGGGTARTSAEASPFAAGKDQNQELREMIQHLQTQVTALKTTKKMGRTAGRRRRQNR
jgi:polyhydroxyalkanoate synthesis repressor PhaR